MRTTLKQKGMWGALLLIAAMPAAHAERNETEARLRDMLRSTTVELRDAQSQNAELRSQLDELKAQRAAPVEKKPSPSVDTAALRRAQQEATELRREVADLRRELDERARVATQAKQTSEQAALLARAHDAEMQQLVQRQQAFDARIEKCERDNAELADIANEVVDRYRQKGVWDALRDNEPLLGIHRVKLEALTQQYHARIVDRQATSTQPAPVSQPSP